jgi:hypothetical protein
MLRKKSCGIITKVITKHKRNTLASRYNQIPSAKGCYGK